MPIDIDRLLTSRYTTREASKQEFWFDFARRRIIEAIAQNQRLQAIAVAMDWASGVCDMIGQKSYGNWKFFKRSLVARWFGPVENKRFFPGWSVREVLEYAHSLGERPIRFSVFPTDIACNARTYSLPIGRREEWEAIIAQTDSSIAIEMFPESSGHNTLCFRRYSSLFGEEALYEAGKGQAVLVFEQERGFHPVVYAQNEGSEYPKIRASTEDSGSPVIRELEPLLRSLIEKHDVQMALRCFSLCRFLGIDALCVEGYYDPLQSRRLSIVDVDLPFDFIFMLEK